MPAVCLQSGSSGSTFFGLVSEDLLFLVSTLSLRHQTQAVRGFLTQSYRTELVHMLFLSDVAVMILESAVSTASNY
jgi:hypothetical protein